MRHINYNHLQYFWTVANEGSVARAAEVMHVTPQTISGQLKLLEDYIGEPLFQRAGRGLVLSDTGRLVKRYADDIFAVGAELSSLVRGRQLHGYPVLHVGIVNSIPKLTAYRILKPVMSSEQRVRLVCQEADLESLLGGLALHRLDIVISDRPIPVGVQVKAYNHELGQGCIAFFVSRRLAARYKREFPGCLQGAPMLLPTTGSALRRDLDDWFERVGVRPEVVAEFDDSALMKAFGQAGAGVFPAPASIAAEIERMYHTGKIGEVEALKETYLAISPERRLRHPAVVAMMDMARENLFND